MLDDATANMLIADSFTKANAAHPAHKLMLSRTKKTLHRVLCRRQRRAAVSPSASNAEFLLHAAYARRRGRTICRSGARF
jgi:hypothetical protein